MYVIHSRQGVIVPNRNKTNLLLVIDSLNPAGGAERQLVELIKGLNKNRFNIHLYCLQGKNKNDFKLQKQSESLSERIEIFLYLR